MSVFYYKKLCVFFIIGLASLTSVNGQQSKHVHSENIIINTIPKSGSTYLAVALSNSLNYKKTQITCVDSAQENCYHTIHEFYATPTLLAKQHFAAPVVAYGPNLGAPKIDMELLRQFTDRKIIHLRDPREVLLSLIHHVNLYKEQAHVLPMRPMEYYTFSFSRQIDWGIDNFLPRIIVWMEEWLAFKDAEDLKPNGFKILITTYDELVANELKLFYKILAFYNISKRNFHHVVTKKDSAVLFRKGDSNEWRQVFTLQQRIRIANMVQPTLLQRFNWNIDNLQS